MASFPRATAVLLLTLLLAGGSPVVPADSAEAIEPTLPTGRYGASLVWTGTHAYLFGGVERSGPTDEIVRFTPATGEVVVMGARLPSPRGASMAAWDGRFAYVLGGSAYPVRHDAILRYDPASDTLETLPAKLPEARWEGSAVWDGRGVLLMGGVVGDGQAWGETDQILRFDPANGTVEPTKATLPTKRSRTAAVWTGTHAHLFGGQRGTGALNEILAYDPLADQVTRLGARLPDGRADVGAAWDGRHAYLFGGYSSTQLINQLDTILRFDPEAGTVTTMGARLPSGRYLGSAFSDGTHAYHLGGWGGGYDQLVVGSNLKEIVRYDVAPGAPGDVEATSGSAAGEVSVSWSGPPGNSYSSPLHGYRIYRASAGGGDVLVAQVDAATLSWVDAAVPPGLHAYRVSAFNAMGEGPRGGPAPVLAV